MMDADALIDALRRTTPAGFATRAAPFDVKAPAWTTIAWRKLIARRRLVKRYRHAAPMRRRYGAFLAVRHGTGLRADACCRMGARPFPELDCGAEFPPMFYVLTLCDLRDSTGALAVVTTLAARIVTAVALQPANGS